MPQKFCYESDMTRNSAHDSKPASSTRNVQRRFHVPPARRRTEFEDLLCDAISKSVAVELRYRASDGSEINWRTYGPDVVYFASEDKLTVRVFGRILSDPKDPSQVGPCTLEVGRIAEMRITQTPFEPDGMLDPFDFAYRNGIICKAV